VRGLAKALSANQMTISRKIEELYEENVVDYRREGRNKVFFLKKTLESKQWACMAESRKQLDIIRKYPRLRVIFEKIRQNPGVTLAVLFGSYANGTATDESDIDVYIDTKEKRIKNDIGLIDTKLNVKIGSYDRENLLIREIEKNHVIIKGADEYYEKNKFFD